MLELDCDCHLDWHGLAPHTGLAIGTPALPAPCLTGTQQVSSRHPAFMGMSCSCFREQTLPDDIPAVANDDQVIEKKSSPTFTLPRYACLQKIFAFTKFLRQYGFYGRAFRAWTKTVECMIFSKCFRYCFNSKFAFANVEESFLW